MSVVRAEAHISLPHQDVLLDWFLTHQGSPIFLHRDLSPDPFHFSPFSCSSTKPQASNLVSAFNRFFFFKGMLFLR